MRRAVRIAMLIKYVSGSIRRELPSPSCPADESFRTSISVLATPFRGITSGDVTVREHL